MIALSLWLAAAPIDVVWPKDGFVTGRITPVTVTVPAGAKPIVSLSARLGARDAAALPFSADRRTWLVLTAVSVEEKPVPQALAIEGALEDGSTVSFRKLVALVAGKYDERKITVGKQFLKPSKKQRLRAQREAQQLSEVLAQKSAERVWRGSFVRPAAGEETSPFGTKRTYNNRRKSRHLGWDLNGEIGDPIVAANRGRVVLAMERFYSGGTVVLDHGGGLFTLYFHMSRIDVQVGDLLEKGQGLGAIGATGQVTGPHLHFAVRFADCYVDPKHLLSLDLSADPLELPAAAAPR